MEILYKKIVETFNNNPQVFTERELPALRLIDINYGQPDNPESFELFFPAMFIAWQILPSATIGENDTLNLDFHIIQEPGRATENFTVQLDAGIEYVRFVKACRYLLNRLKCPHITPLRYAGERQNTTPYFRYHIVSYTCGIEQDQSSIWRPEYTSGSIESIKIKEGFLRNSVPGEEPDIDVFK